MQEPMLSDVPPTHEAPVSPIPDLISDFNLISEPLPISDLMRGIDSIRKLHERYLKLTTKNSNAWTIPVINQRIAFEKEFMAHIKHIAIDSEAIVNRLQMAKESKIQTTKSCCEIT